MNYYRSLAQLPAATENGTWSDGDWKHSRYMVKNTYIGHSEDPDNPWYTPEGDAAARNGNVMVDWSFDTSDQAAIDMWMQGPFHAVGILDPALREVGYGSYRETGSTFQMAGTLDVLRGLGDIPSSVAFPVAWPSSGTTVPLRSYNGSESPDPLSGCIGYNAPAGLPIVLQLGDGSLTPSVTGHALIQGNTSLEHCIYDETSYRNADPTQQELGRSILSSRDAVVLIPKTVLAPGTRYTVSITANGRTYTWSFTTAN